MTGPALFHFSEDGGIACFTPRPVAVPAVRAPGMDWLNGPLVWAIDDRHQPMYLFPRDCPRILLWPTDATTDEDRARLWPSDDLNMIAYVEQDWLPRLQNADLYRYSLPLPSFQPLHDAGMWVSRETVTPERMDRLTDLPDRLEALDVQLRPVPDLRPLRPLWDSSLHVSGIRLRHAAKGWP